MLRRKIPERFLAQQRNVAREKNDGAVLPDQRGLGHEQRVRRAELWLLHHKAETGAWRERLTHRVGLMTDDDGGGRGRENRRRVKDVMNERPSGDLVEDLGPRRLHARPLAGG